MKVKKHEAKARVTKLISDQCQEAGEHTAFTRATFTIGTKVRVTILCIHCNRWERRWIEYRNTTGA